MATTLITLTPDQEVYEAIDILLKHKISGAPVVGSSKELVGILSEKDCLKVLTYGSYHHLPGGKVSEYMSAVIQSVDPYADIISVADLFLKNSFRRLPVVQNGRLIGQISRRDVLKAIQKMRK